MFETSHRSQLTSASSLLVPGVGTYNMRTLRPATATAPNLYAFNCTGLRSELSLAAYPAAPHAYAPVVVSAPPRRDLSPSFGCTAIRPSLVAPGAWAAPGPGAYDIAGSPRGSPLTLPRGRVLRRRAVSVASLAAPLRRSAPSIPYAAPSPTAPSPAEYTLPRPPSQGGGANVLFGRNRAPRMPVGGPYGGGGACSPGPGSSNPGLAAGVGGVYKAGVPLSSMARPVSPSGAFPDRSAGLIARDAADTPGPGAYLGPWGGSGFLAAARRDVPEGLQFLGSRAARGDMTQWAGSAAGSPGPGAYGEGAFLRPPSPMRGSPLGGSEQRFRLPPDEAAARANPGPGAYGSGWAGLKLPSARRGRRSPSPTPAAPPRALSPGTAAALLDRALAAAADARSGEGAPPTPPASPAGGSPPRPPPRASPLQPIDRALSPGPIYDTSAPLVGRSFNAAAARGALMGRCAERGAGGALAAAVAAEGPGPGAYNVPRAPVPLPARPPDMGPAPEAFFGKARRRVEMSGGEGGEYTNPQKPWAFTQSFNAKAFVRVNS